MSGVAKPTLRATAAFQAASGVERKLREAKKHAAPFSLRLTAEERAYLKQLAGSRPLGAYIRDRLLGDRAETRRELRQPKLDDEQYASLLAALGQSRLSSNLNQLAKSANMGSLDVSQDVEEQLEDAYKAVLAMREALFMALGLKSGVGR